MDIQSSDHWEYFSYLVGQLHKRIAQSKATKVNAIGLRDEAQQVVHVYFRQARPELQALGIEGEYVSQLDEALQTLLRLSKGSHGKKSYVSLIKLLSKILLDVSGSIEFRHAEAAFLSLSSASISLSEGETFIYDTLLKIIPSAALSYKQALLDLVGDKRISYRGVATELRESLRETLDHLAPDKEVVAQPNFKYEPDKKAPTMKQKVRFILKVRELPDNASKSPEDAIGVVEERIASFARSVYERSSISTHVRTQKSEVLQVKKYVDIVLSELLGIHA